MNAGDPWRARDPGPPAADSIDGFARALQRGIGILALHTAVSSTRDYPEWYPAIGGMWVPTLSYHPPAGETEITGVGNDERIIVEPFRVFDERYCRLQQLGPSTVVAHHGGAHGQEPTAWVRRIGSSRIAVDLLGHDERSYESPSRRALPAELARWATNAPASANSDIAVADPGTEGGSAIIPGMTFTDDRGGVAQLHGVGLQRIEERWWAWGEDKSAVWLPLELSNGGATLTHPTSWRPFS